MQAPMFSNRHNRYSSPEKPIQPVQFRRDGFVESPIDPKRESFNREQG